MQTVTELPMTHLADAVAIADVLRASAAAILAMDPYQHPAAFCEALRAIGDGVIQGLGEYAARR